MDVMHAIATLLEVKVYSPNGFCVQFLANRDRDKLEQLLDAFAREHYFMGANEFSFYSLSLLIKGYFRLHFRRHIDIMIDCAQRERVVYYLVQHLEEALQIMGLFSWVMGRVRFWFFLFTHPRMCFFPPEKLMDLLEGFILPKDVHILVEHNILSRDQISQLSWKMIEQATCPMSLSREQLKLPGYIFTPDPIVINRLQFVALRKCIHLRFWYLQDMCTGTYSNEKVSIHCFNDDLSEFVWGVMSDVLPQIHFQNLGYLVWETMFIFLVREALSEFLKKDCDEKNRAFDHFRVQNLLTEEVLGLVALCRPWVELLILANSMLASCGSHTTLPSTNLEQVMCKVKEKQIFDLDQNQLRRAIFLLWCLRSRPASIYHAACARVIAKEWGESKASIYSART